jgi:GAF domain-containing protein
MAASFAALAVADMVNWTPFGFIPSPALWMLIGVMYAVAGPLLVYAVLRNQVLDFAFAVNRTAVFGATSLALIGAFAALNAGIERLLHLQVGEGSRWLDIGLAFGLAIIAARLRRLIERVIERTLFRSWRERERRMQEWLERLPSHLEAPSLLMALKDEASHFTGSTCEAYLATPDGSYAAQGHAVLAADDPLAVAMRATGRAQKGNGAIGLAVPMRHGAALQGFLALGRKPEGGTFRPDEIALLEEAARSTANQWQTLRMASQDRDMAQLRTRLEESREALALIGTRMGMRLISINDLSEIRGGGEEVARPVLWNYRGATSESISIEKVI